MEKKDLYNNILKNWQVPHTKTDTQVWEELQQKLGKVQARETKVIQFNWRRWASVAAAAAVIVAVAIAYWPDSGRMLTVSSDHTHNMKATLPDGSSIIMNTHSQISYNENWNRELKLEGEAFFEVTHGNTFTVQTSNGQIQVLGTSFNVFSRNGQLRVHCETGKVKVTVADSDQILVPGEYATVVGGDVVKSTFDLSKNNWTDGEFTYDHEPLTNVFDEIERQFNVELETPEVDGKMYSGVFYNDNLEEALSLVCEPMGLQFTVQENALIKITGK